jgi:hypothetical protein
MINKFFLIYLIVLSLLFSACSYNKTEVPFWINSHTIDDGKIYAIGESRKHIKGKAYQKKLAISRALENLASQKGVKVSNQTSIINQLDNNIGSTNMSSHSVHTIDGNNINAKIVNIYYDKYKEILYVRMVLNE